MGVIRLETEKKFGIIQPGVTLYLVMMALDQGKSSLLRMSVNTVTVNVCC